MDFRMTEKTPEEQARDAAEFSLEVERQKKIALLVAGKLNFPEAEALTHELCEQGDVRQRLEDARAEKESRERGARIRAGTYRA
jgi:hypothetical protein